MASDSYTVIPAQPGYFVIYGESGELFGPPFDAVIAWRIKTEQVRTDLMSSVSPITTDGDPADNWMGYMNPDGTVEVFDSRHESFESAQAWYREYCRKE